MASLGQRSACLPFTRRPIGGEARGKWGGGGGGAGNAGANGVEGGELKVEFVEFNHELRDILTSVRMGLVVLPLSESNTGVSSRSLLLFNRSVSRSLSTRVRPESDTGVARGLFCSLIGLFFSLIGLFLGLF